MDYLKLSPSQLDRFHRQDSNLGTSLVLEHSKIQNQIEVAVDLESIQAVTITQNQLKMVITETSRNQFNQTD